MRAFLNHHDNRQTPGRPRHRQVVQPSHPVSRSRAGNNLDLWISGSTVSKSEMMQNPSLLLGIGIGLFGALAILAARYIAVVLG
jgi:hypothetical protein